MAKKQDRTPGYEDLNELAERDSRELTKRERLERLAQEQHERRNKTRGEKQREAELDFAKDTGSKREITKAEARLKRLRDALAERRGGKK